MKKAIIFSLVLAFGSIIFVSCSEEEILPEPAIEDATFDGVHPVNDPESLPPRPPKK